jgi:uncharacterized damage-inducible protein DinB
MTLQDVQALVDYHYWARDRLLKAVEPLTPEQFTKELGNSFSSIRDTLVHLCGADWIWVSRWEGVSPGALPGTSGFDDLPSVRAAWAEQERRIRTLIDRLGEEGIQGTFSYMRNGQPHANVFWQMLQHLVNHGSYHRGQVTTMLRQLGAAPAESMDLITFYRERAAASA